MTPASSMSCGTPSFNPRTRVGCDAAAAWLRGAAYEGFNPRTRVGCDQHQRAVGPGGQPGFNPRTRVGCDAGRSRSGWWPCSFNPRTRVGCDFPSISFHLLPQSFNPRTRVGCDVLGDVLQRAIPHVSIHAPAWGATGPRPRRSHAARVSIHAPAWGATPAIRMVIRDF